MTGNNGCSCKLRGGVLSTNTRAGRRCRCRRKMLSEAVSAEGEESRGER
jgi:hypothetical protein